MQAGAFRQRLKERKRVVDGALRQCAVLECEDAVFAVTLH
jgi:hypothetical protein